MTETGEADEGLNEHRINMDGISKGIYFVNLENDGMIKQLKKLVVN